MYGGWYPRTAALQSGSALSAMLRAPVLIKKGSLRTGGTSREVARM